MTSQLSKWIVRFFVAGILSALLAGCSGSTVPVVVTITTATPLPNVEKPSITNYKDAVYQVEGTPITLINGVSEMETAPDSVSKTITRYFGNDAFGDLNGDGKEDVAFLLMQNSGGSGTLFYAVVALRTETGYMGTNAVLLGDRIAPQSTTIEDGMVITNYADRKPGESFTTRPSVGITKYLKIMDGKLIEVNDISQITNREWKWVNVQMNDGALISPKKVDAFTITFTEDGSFSGTTDCNNFFGMYEMDDNKLSFGTIGSTKKACEGSQESEFLNYLGEIGSYYINSKEDLLVLLIKFDSRSMMFK